MIPASYGREFDSLHLLLQSLETSILMCILCVELTKSRVQTGRQAGTKDRAREIKKELVAVEASLTTEVDVAQQEHLTGIRDRLRNEQYEVSRKI